MVLWREWYKWFFQRSTSSPKQQLWYLRVPYLCVRYSFVCPSFWFTKCEIYLHIFAFYPFPELWFAFGLLPVVSEWIRCLCLCHFCFVAVISYLMQHKLQLFLYIHDDVIKWKHFPRYWHLCGEFTGLRWIPRTKASDAELWYFLWSASE